MSMMPIPLPFTTAAFTPPAPGADEARKLAEAELAKGMYSTDPSLLDRFLRWLGDTLFEITLGLDPASGGAGSIAVIAIIVALVAIVVFFAVRRSRLSSTRASRAAQVDLFGDDRTSSQLFAAADKAQASGDLTLAVVELYRAIIRRLNERGLITVIPGMTALEAARAGANRLGATELFSRCATTFNEIYYWHGQATPDDVAALRALHRHIESAQVSA